MGFSYLFVHFVLKTSWFENVQAWGINDFRNPLCAHHAPLSSAYQLFGQQMVLKNDDAHLAIRKSIIAKPLVCKQVTANHPAIETHKEFLTLIQVNVCKWVENENRVPLSQSLIVMPLVSEHLPGINLPISSFCIISPSAQAHVLTYCLLGAQKIGEFCQHWLRAQEPHSSR